MLFYFNFHVILIINKLCKETVILESNAFIFIFNKLKGIFNGKYSARTIVTNKC